MKSTLALAYEAGLKPFDAVHATVNINRSLGDLASSLLGDRNRYFSKEYRERFGTRVHSLEVFCARLVLGCVESAQPPGPNTARRFRAVMFDCDGIVRHQTRDERVLDQHAAMVELHYEASKLNEGEVLRQLIERHLSATNRIRDNAERVLNALMKHGP